MNKNKIEITGDMDLGAYSPLELSESQETNNSSKLTMSKLSKMIAESIKALYEDNVDALSKEGLLNENLNEISDDTADEAYMKAFRDSNALPYGSPMRIKRDAQFKNLKKLRNDKLGFDPSEMSRKMKQSGTSGDDRLDRKWARWQQNHDDRISGRRVYDKEKGKWVTKISKSDLMDSITESIQNHLVNILGKYTAGKASSEQANKAIMDLANSSNMNESVDKDMEERIRKTVRQMLKSGELPDGKDEKHGLEMAEWYDKILKKSINQGVDEVGGDLNVMISVIDDEFGKQGGNYDLKNEPNHKKSVDNLLKKIVNESLEDEMLAWKQRDNSEFGQTLKQLERIAEDGLIDAGSIINHLRTEYALDGNMQATARSVIHYLREYDFICVDEDGNDINIENSNSPEAAQLCIKLKELSQQKELPLNEEFDNKHTAGIILGDVRDKNNYVQSTILDLQKKGFDLDVDNWEMYDNRDAYVPFKTPKSNDEILKLYKVFGSNLCVDNSTWSNIEKLQNHLFKQESLNESYAQEGNYTHFAVNKTTNKIVNGWDYSGYDTDELRMYKRDYFTDDLVDYGLDPRQYTIITRVGCKKRGINPDDDSQWENGQVVNEGDGNDPYYGQLPLN